SENQNWCRALPTTPDASAAAYARLRRKKMYARYTPIRNTRAAITSETSSVIGTECAPSVHGRTVSRNPANGALTYPPTIDKNARAKHGMSIGLPGRLVTS